MAALVSTLAVGIAGRVHAEAPIYLADMHRHLYFNRLASGESMPFGAAMADGRATLVAWALTADVLWIGRGARGFEQKSEPPAGAAFGYFQRELGRIREHLAKQGVRTVATPADVMAALAGTPHAVLATEGSLFLDTDLARLRLAYDLGVRHVQLVHYTRNPVADFQTERPTLGGLTAFGREVVQTCERLGILVDLAHCTERVVDQVLEIATKPVVWSHGSIADGGRPDWTMIGWRARQLNLDCARRIARKGGVVGLWAFRRDAGATFASYADRMLRMADQIGEDHVAFGTDLTATPSDVDFGLFKTYADLRQVVSLWQSRGVPETRIRKLAIENYARVLRIALSP